MNTQFKIEQLQAGYGQKSIIPNLSTSIQKGKITTIIGPNGCGKSTLLKSIGRLLKKQSGQIFMQQQNMDTLSTKEIAKQIAILSQSPSGPGQLKVHELIAYGRYPHRANLGKLTTHDQEKIRWAMEVTNTLEYATREVDELSGGQRQRVWLAMALAQETDTLLLDEPTTYLDMAHQLEVLEIAYNLNKKHQCTIVMVLHDINQAARYSDEIIAMKNGEVLYQGSPTEVMTKPVLKDLFQVDAKVVVDDGTPICLSYALLAKGV